MKVCHMTSVHPAEDVRIFHKMCVSLARAGHETVLVAPGDSYEKEGVRIIGVGEKPTSRIRRLAGLSRRVYGAALAQNADLYHFHDPELLPYGLRLKRQGKRVVFDSHEDYGYVIREKTWIPGPLRSMVSALYTRYLRYAAPKLDAVLTVTPHMQTPFVDMRCKTAVISNFPLHSEAIPPAACDGRRVGFAGNIADQWCHEAILKAVNQVEGACYDLAGMIRPQYLQTLREAAGEGKLCYHGRLPFSQVPALIARWTAGMCVLRHSPSFGGTIGTLGNTKLFECLQAGVPVICTDFVLWREIIDAYDCGICVDPTDVGAIAAAIRRLVDDPREARRMGENGQRAIAEKYNWDAEFQKLLALYRDLLPGMA